MLLRYRLLLLLVSFLIFFFFNDTATTEIYTLSLHDALPICSAAARSASRAFFSAAARRFCSAAFSAAEKKARSEEHTSELQSHLNLVCRLLLEKKKKIIVTIKIDCDTQSTVLSH